MIEIWKDVKGYEGLYECSNLGKVRSFDREIIYNNGIKHIHKGKELKGIVNKNGYVHITLVKDGIKKQFLLHRIIAITFLPNPNNLPCVNHKSEDKQDNKVSNLEWCTHKYNLEYSNCMDLFLSKKKRVGQYNTSGELLNVFDGVREAFRQTGIDYRNISKSCICGSYITGGYIWKLI